MSCSLEWNSEKMAVAASTLANGGVNPVTGERVFSNENVKNSLSLMFTCGLSDHSGKFAFDIGFPAKSGISGAFMVVIPGVLGMCIYSPRLNNSQISHRGLEFCKHFSDRFNFHQFDSIAEAYKTEHKVDPRNYSGTIISDISQLLYAASVGDVWSVRNLQVLKNIDLNAADYDLRTAIHLAAAEGKTEMVRYLIDKGAKLAPKDRWGNTPLDDAKRANHNEVVEILTDALKAEAQNAQLVGL